MACGRAGIDLKFVRALNLCDEIEKECTTYLSSGAITLDQDVEAETGHFVARARVRSQPPIELSALVGDALHNARSALDHLAWRLVEVSGGTPTRSTGFPFTDVETGFGNALRSSLHGVPTNIRRQVQELKPWFGGDADLWALHHLDILDKHRLLIPVAAVNRGVLTGMTITIPGHERMDGPFIEILAAGPADPLTDGMEVWRDMSPESQQQVASESPFKSKNRVTFDIVFAQGSRVAGLSVVPTVRGLVMHARDAVEALVTLVV